MARKLGLKMDRPSRRHINRAYAYRRVHHSLVINGLTCFLCPKQGPIRLTGGAVPGVSEVARSSRVAGILECLGKSGECTCTE